MTSTTKNERRTYIKYSLILFSSILYPKKGFTKGRDTFQQGRSVQEFFKGNWTEALNNAFKAADVVIIPAGTKCENINSNILIPNNKTLLVEGVLSGNNKGCLELGDNNKIIGHNGRLENVQIKITTGTHEIDGLEMTGYLGTARIMIIGEKEISKIKINNLYIHDSNYGILRQGKKSKLSQAIITNCRFENLKGDAIEWNVAINDDQLLIANHTIKNIDNSDGVKYWGIGIGLSGGHYDNNYPDESAVKNFIVENIKGENLRQLIHVENGKNFKIRNIQAKNIDETYSVKSGLDSATIAIYGSDNFKISNVDIKDGNGIFVGFGVMGGKYVAAPQNFTIENVNINNAKQIKKGLKIETGNDDSKVLIKDIKITGSQLTILNKPKALTLENISVKSFDDKIPGIDLSLKHYDGRSAFSVRKGFIVSNENVQSISSSGEVKSIK